MWYGYLLGDVFHECFVLFLQYTEMDFFIPAIAQVELNDHLQSAIFVIERFDRFDLTDPLCGAYR